MGFQEFAKLENGTVILYTWLEYTGVCFLCITPDKGSKNRVKRAMAIWPTDLEPLRFFNVKGYSLEEIDVLRREINKVGDEVLMKVLEEAEKR